MAREAKVKAHVDAILKLCKREPRAKAAVLDSGAPRGLEACAEGREMGGPLSPRGEIPPLTPLHRGARNDDDGDGEDEDHYHPNLPRRRQLRRELLARIRALPTDTDVVSYDSDDDPNELVGRRIEVRWSGGQFYGGVVIKHDHLGHHVRYDAGAARVYADILATPWRVA